MTIEEAVKILNDRKHHAHSGWYALRELVRGEDQYEGFEHFEAIAIAEKYAREAS